MGRKINVNVCIVIIAMTTVITIIISLIAYGLSEKYAGEFSPSTLKGFINSSLPLVEYTYDSGKTEFSILAEIKDTVYGFTGVDTKNPLRMLSDSSSLNIYFSNNYWNDSLNPENPDYLDDPDEPKDPILTPNPTQTQNPPGPSETPGTSGPAKTPEPSKPSGEGKYAKGDIVTIRNGSKLDIDINKILKTPFKSKFDKDTDGAQVLIYHTHTTESYIKDLSELDNNNYDSWSSDNSKTVVRVGHELDSILNKQYGFNVIHNSTVHNSNYSQSYNKSSVTVRSVLKGNPTVKLSIDIHRDGLALGTGKLRLVQKVKGEDCAKIMFVVGTNENADNPNWEDNLRLAVILSEKLEELAPGIMRHISIRSGRYNQHIAENGLLVEFGGDGNTVSEVTASAKYLAAAINEVFKN